MLRAYGVRNFRSLADSGPIELRPLTIFVGRNSSGKSSLLRVLPLLRQSVETRTTGPILWWGDLVDFGSFAHVLRRSSENPEIAISLQLSVERRNARVSSIPSVGYRGLFRTRRIPHLQEQQEVVYTVELGLTSDTRGFTRVTRLKISWQNTSVEMGLEWGEDEGEAATRRIVVNGLCVSPPSEAESPAFSTLESTPLFEVFTGPTTLIPLLLPTSQQAVLQRMYKPRSKQNKGRHSTLFFAIFRELDKLLHGKGDTDYVAGIADDLIRRWPGSMEHALRTANDSDYYQRNLRRALARDGWLQHMEAMQALAWIPTVTMALDTQLAADARSVAYTGPFRALPRRFYRAQDLQVDNVSPNGENLAMFLWSLSEGERKSFSRLLRRHFGYGIKVTREEGLVRLHIERDRTGQSDNITDVGFGVSQVLPVLAQAWARGRRSSRDSLVPRSAQSIVVLEQPELHLHPAHQTALGEALVRLSRISSGRKVRQQIVVETHSDHLINAVGRAVRESEIDWRNVVVYRFEDAKSEDQSRIVKSEFGQDGILQNWPFDFFIG